MTARAEVVEWLLAGDVAVAQLFRSERTGDMIREDLLVPHHPPRRHFDILRGARLPREWPGRTHVPSDPPGRSRWATLTALRVLDRYAS